MKETIIIDCDPGQDDAINLLLALSSPGELDVLGITTVAGNVPLDLTERNARMMCDIAGRTDVPVFAGCAKPLLRELITAENVHGKTGVDGVEVFTPTGRPQDRHAVDFIIDALRSADDASITLVPTGPLTNIAAAIQKDPSILAGIRRIVLMGGAMREGGNTSPSAEFNILVDPHAAEIVFDCGRPITAMGLDVTHQVLSSRERIARIKAVGNRAAEATAGMLEFFSRHDSTKYGADGAPLHDPCTIAFLLQPELFEGKLCNIAIETRSPLTLGHTAVDFWGVSGRSANATWIYRVNADGFYELLTERLARLK
ncbi:MAG: nucleoside hydrolase [Gammaproteobacteria bacterium]|nr:nucleoside hydrolase [Gammaproteobacteria bacterium]MDH4314064.1 nucleoside hydrolase [Gammaproteobacteria bacterium]MDH5215850.1 nucleoside hydrolase [Gammaproteobacteria bacterium]MDH5501764.1 nucleoside hydrolase [Gammaproteobacteria bacterium]